MQTKKRKACYKLKEKDFGFVIWSQIAKEQKLTSEHVGKRVWVAGEFSTKERILKAVHKKGEKSWPDGGFEVVEVERGIIRFYPTQKCRLHPKELRKNAKRKNLGSKSV